MIFFVDAPHQKYDGVLYIIEPSGATLYDEVYSWLLNDIGPRYSTWDWYNNDIFTFSNETDAMAFKLRWL